MAPLERSGWHALGFAWACRPKADGMPPKRSLYESLGPRRRSARIPLDKETLRKARKSLVACVALVAVAAAGWVGRSYEGAGGNMTKAAQQLLASLSSDQKAKASMAYDDPKRLKWHFIPLPERKGLQIKEMTAEQ